jgi:Ca2+-binding EF-hand superfamily protein/oligoribonuclease (3'-5' exoribonuclease)
MGAGGSVLTDVFSETAVLPNSRLFAPVVDLFLEVEELKNKIAQCEATIIHDHMGQMYIPHTQLIDRIMIHSKAQQQRIKDKYNSIDLTMNITDEFATRLGGPYGEFMKHSMMSYLQIRLDLLSAAMTGLGCDEELLVEVVCLCNEYDLADLKMGVSRQMHKNVSKEKIVGKTKKDSQLQKFLLRALEDTRDDESVPVDCAEAHRQMMILHEIATSKSRNGSEYLDVLMRCSRGQCAAIADAYQKQYQFSLESSIQSVFRGVSGRAVALWSMPLLDACVYEIKAVMDDTTFRDGDDTVLSVARLVSMRDKGELHIIEETYKQKHDENLISVFDNFAYGNIRAAIVRRFENSFIDNGAEMNMNAYVKTNGGTMYSTFEHGHSIAQMTGFLTEMKNKYIEYLSKNASDHKSAKEHVSSKVVENPAENTAGLKGAQFGMAKMNSTRTFTAADRQVYRDNFQHMADFMRKQFKSHDYDRSGSLDSVEFWTMMSDLDLGLTAKDIEEIKLKSDWDRDGFITFEEASHELVDVIMNLMELQGKNMRQEITRLAAQEDLEQSVISGTGSLSTDAAAVDPRPEKDEPLPPNLPRYLKASFDAYDTDKSGYLDRIEFWKFIKSIFTDAFTDFDIEMMQVLFCTVLFCVCLMIVRFLIIL